MKSCDEAHDIQFQYSFKRFAINKKLTLKDFLP